MTLTLLLLRSGLVGGGAAAFYFGFLDHSLPEIALGFVALLGGLAVGITARGARGNQ